MSGKQEFYDNLRIRDGRSYADLRADKYAEKLERQAQQGELSADVRGCSPDKPRPSYTELKAEVQRLRDIINDMYQAFCKFFDAYQKIK